MWTRVWLTAMLLGLLGAVRNAHAFNLQWACEDGTSLQAALIDAISSSGENSGSIELICDAGRIDQTVTLSPENDLYLYFWSDDTIVWSGTGDGLALSVAGHPDYYTYVELSDLVFECLDGASQSLFEFEGSEMVLSNVVVRDCADTRVDTGASVLYLTSGTATILDSLFWNASSSGDGAIRVSGASINLRRSVFYLDATESSPEDQAWALFLSSANSNISNTAFIADVPATYAVYADTGHIELENSMFDGGSAGSGGVWISDDASSDAVNTVFTGLTEAVLGNVDALDSRRNSWWNNDADGSYGEEDVLDDPLLGALDWSGGCWHGGLCLSDLEIWPAPTSPLLGAGDPSLTDCNDCGRTDIGVVGGCEAIWPDLLDTGDGGGDGDVDDDCTPDFADCEPEDSGIGEPTAWWPDTDEDGYGDRDQEESGCVAPEGSVTPSEDTGTSDCDDEDAKVHPEAEEIVNDDIDQDCDGWVICYLDLDEDGYPSASDDTVEVFAEVGCPDEDGLDCMDVDASIHPGAEDGAGDGDLDCDGWDTTPGKLGLAGCSCASARGAPGPRSGLMILVAIAALRARCARFQGASHSPLSHRGSGSSRTR